MMMFFEMGGYSMFSMLLCSLAGLLVALYATSRPSEPRIVLAERLAKADVFFALAGYASNVAATFHYVTTHDHGPDGYAMILITGLYESTAPVIMGFTFVALIHTALAIAAFRLAKQAP